jgi:squalene-hopene/tetraprenyl-beta-curcumene cyclase
MSDMTTRSRKQNLPTVRTSRGLKWLACVFIAITASAADWSPKLAADYLDSRQKEWFAWKQAASPDGPCVSCHTGLTYLLARPALRGALGESEPTLYEKGLLDRLRSKAGVKPEGALQSVEVIFSALFLGQKDAPAALDQLWSLQLQDGKAKGAWTWYSAALDPWENPGSSFYGASLAALAAGMSPVEYLNRPEIRERTKALSAFLQTGVAAQPLHDRLALLWASSKFPEALPQPMRRQIIQEVMEKQQPDGGWSIESLGPWMAHPQAPTAGGSNSYATAFSAFVLEQARIPRSEPKLSRSLDWLRSHQDAHTGAWPAVSMNKIYPAGSMESRFLQDAATSFAALALLDGAK